MAEDVSLVLAETYRVAREAAAEFAYGLAALERSQLLLNEVTEYLDDLATDGEDEPRGTLSGTREQMLRRRVKKPPRRRVKKPPRAKTVRKPPQTFPADRIKVIEKARMKDGFWYSWPTYRDGDGERHYKNATRYTVSWGRHRHQVVVVDQLADGEDDYLQLKWGCPERWGVFTESGSGWRTASQWIESPLIPGKFSATVPRPLNPKQDLRLEEEVEVTGVPHLRDGDLRPALEVVPEPHSKALRLLADKDDRLLMIEHGLWCSKVRGYLSTGVSRG